MIKRVAAVALAVALYPAAATAEKIDMSTITCAQLLKSPEAEIGVLLTWMHGYVGGESNGTIFDTDAFTKSAEDIAKYCVTNPETSLMNAVKETVADE